jgi:hypothetical protein
LSGTTNVLNSAFESLILKIKDRLNTDFGEEIQFELAKILNLIPFFFQYESLVKLLDLFEVAALSLLTDKPNLKFANAIRIDLENQIFDIKDSERHWLSPWRYWRNPCVRVLTGLVLNVLLAIVYGLYFFRLWNTNPEATIFGILAYKIAIVTIMGMFGSIVSIMLRIRDYEAYRGEYASTLFITGFTKPLIGALFSLFMLTVISSNILPLDYEIIDKTAFYFFSALSFVTGFSERLAQGLIKKTEEAII